MVEFGGLGGVPGGRPRDETDLFEAAVDRALGDALRSDVVLCSEMWSSLANVDWSHRDGDCAGYSFRAAGDLISAVLGRGDYTDWYCSGPSAHVSDRIAEALAREGWTWTLSI